MNLWPISEIFKRIAIETLLVNFVQRNLTQNTLLMDFNPSDQIENEIFRMKSQNNLISVYMWRIILMVLERSFFPAFSKPSTISFKSLFKLLKITLKTTKIFVIRWGLSHKSSNVPSSSIF